MNPATNQLITTPLAPPRVHSKNYVPNTSLTNATFSRVQSAIPPPTIFWSDTQPTVTKRVPFADEYHLISYPDDPDTTHFMTVLQEYQKNQKKTGLPARKKVS